MAPTKQRLPPPVSLALLRVDDVRISVDAERLFEDHWQEVALNKRVMKLKPNWLRYYELEEKGALFSLGAFAGQQLIGYSVNFILNHLHYADLCCAHNDLLFVDAAHRRGRVGLQLIHATEREAKQRGAQLMLWHAKQGTVMETLLARIGYGVQDVIYSREL